MEMPIPKMGSGRLQRFWAKVDIKGPDECWNWQAAKSKSGYGKLKMGNVDYRAHRIAWLIEYGKFPNESCCHVCDNRACVNVKHMFDGSSYDNILDAAKKGRLLHGITHTQAKLNDSKVRAIRDLHNTGAWTLQALADAYHVNVTTIQRVVIWQTWTHVK